MLQIKTIKETDPDRFDKRVNEALADGWTLSRRLAGSTDFVAELEKEIITEDERSCENCKFGDQSGNLSPCCDCDEYASKWEAEE